MNTKLLNSVKDKMIEICNQQGIRLDEHFDNPDEFKQYVIALVFTELTKSGVDVEKAFDFIFGEGSYQKLSGEVFDLLQKNA